MQLIPDKSMKRLNHRMINVEIGIMKNIIFEEILANVGVEKKREQEFFLFFLKRRGGGFSE